MSVAVNSITDQWDDGQRLHTVGTLAFSGSYTTGGDTLNLGSGGLESSGIPSLFEVFSALSFAFHYVPGTGATSGKLIVRGGASGAAASGTITDGNATNVSNGDKVTIGSVVYTFKITPTLAYDVKIGGSADASLTSLVNTINGVGVVGTDVAVAVAAHTLVSASAVASHVSTITALTIGTSGNAVVLTTTSSHLTISGAGTLASGVDGTLTSAEIAASTYPLIGTPEFYCIQPKLW